MEPHDAQEKRIRFGCGFVLGLVLGSYVGLRLLPWSGYVIAVVVFLSAIGCGILAMKQGDRFWFALTSLRWWR